MDVDAIERDEMMRPVHLTVWYGMVWYSATFVPYIRV